MGCRVCEAVVGLHLADPHGDQTTTQYAAQQGSGGDNDIAVKLETQTVSQFRDSADRSIASQISAARRPSAKVGRPSGALPSIAA